MGRWSVHLPIKRDSCPHGTGLTAVGHGQVRGGGDGKEAGVNGGHGKDEAEANGRCGEEGQRGERDGARLFGGR